MSKEELIEILNVSIEALKTNKELLSKDLLDKCEKLVYDYKDDPLVQSLLKDSLEITEEKVENIFKVILKVIKLERKLVEDGLTEKIISGVQNLENRPLVLRMLAALL